MKHAVTTILCALLLTIACVLPVGVVRASEPTGATGLAPAPSKSARKIHASLARHWRTRDPSTTVKAWVVFTDKGFGGQRNVRAATAALATKYNPRAVQRRRLRRTRPGLFDFDDLPVQPSYVAKVTATGARLHLVSRWLNAASVIGDKRQIEAISLLPFVKEIRRVAVGRRITPEQPLADTRTAEAPVTDANRSGGAFYGQAEAQLTQINLPAVHSAGFTGDGVIVGIMDSGFKTTHVAFNDAGNPLVIAAEHDFVDDDPNPQGEFFHGTFVLGTMAAFAPNDMVGGAYDASYILCRTEDNASETPVEEDNMVAALEFIEANGGDVATTSLGYFTFDPDFADADYTQADMDGVTAISTKGVNIATDNGLHVLTSVGNAGNDNSPSTATLGAPADAFKIISVGAVTDTGDIASFSSTGPTADGRVKPEVLARGVNTRSTLRSDDTGYGGSNGTSFSAPLTAAAVACLTQAHPEWTVDQMRYYLFQQSAVFVGTGEADPLFVRGYGIIDAFASLDGDCDGNGVDDATDIANGTFDDCDGNGLPDVCDLSVLGEALDCDQNGGIDFCDVTLLGFPDCNGNLVPDGCDPDCNGDGVPDDCEADPADQDCDGDGVCDGEQIAGCPGGDPSCADCNQNGIPDVCDIASGFATDDNENGIPDVCDASTPRIPAAPFSFSKNRFVSIVPNNAVIPVVLRIELLDLACSVTGLKCNNDSECKACIGGNNDGDGCIISSDCPGGACEFTGEPCIEQSPPVMLGWVDDPFEPQTDKTPPGTMGARVTRTMPNPRLWGESVLHIGDCEIAPVQTYAISVSTNGTTFTEPLVVGTARKPQGKSWGDFTGNFDGVSWSDQNYLLNIDEVVAILNFIMNKGGIHITRIDLGPEIPNFIINATDLQLVLRAFSGEPYPPISFPNKGSPSDCP